MNSITKSNITEEILKTMVNLAFPLAELHEAKELTEGYFNAAYLFALSDGREVILKIAPPKGVLVMTNEIDIMRAEVGCMELLSEHTDIPIPKVLFHDFSHSICPSDYFFMSKLNGKSFSSLQEAMTKEQKDSIEQQTGKYNAVINKITGNGFGYYNSIVRDSNWFDVFTSFLEKIFQDAAKISLDIGVDFESINNLLQTHRDSFLEVTTPRLVHWDLWAGNVFVEKDKVTGFIDFERCIWGDELLEVGFRSHNQNPSFLEGYGKKGFTEAEKVRILWYDFYLFAIASLESDFRKYPDRGMFYWAKEQLEKTLKALREV
ncbi:MAG: aminoglycoside phosphotransferase [Anaerocolumna sp.]|jgi:fructosamine-3-kinase|nr:aminoglycoside phosphotransferase [Anaerocolumna sp.]